MKNLTSLAFHLLTNIDVISTIVLILFYSSDSRLLDDLDTLRRRSYNAIYCYCEKLIFYQLILLLVILKLFEVSLEVEFMLKFKVEFMLEFEEFDIEFELVELLELELVIEGFISIIEGFLIELFKEEE